MSDDSDGFVGLLLGSGMFVFGSVVSVHSDGFYGNRTLRRRL